MAEDRFESHHQMTIERSRCLCLSRCSSHRHPFLTWSLIPTMYPEEHSQQWLSDENLNYRSDDKNWWVRPWWERCWDCCSTTIKKSLHTNCILQIRWEITNQTIQLVALLLNCFSLNRKRRGVFFWTRTHLATSAERDFGQHPHPFVTTPPLFLKNIGANQGVRDIVDATLLNSEHSGCIQYIDCFILLALYIASYAYEYTNEANKLRCQVGQWLRLTRLRIRNF